MQTAKMDIEANMKSLQDRLVSFYVYLNLYGYIYVGRF